MRAVMVLCGLLCCGISVTAVAETAENWLLKTYQSTRTISFSGTFIYERPGYFSTHAVWRDASGALPEDRYARLDGSPVELIRAGGKVRCTSDAFELQFPAARSWQSGSFDLAGLSQGYRIRSAGTSRVAGRAAVIVDFLPRDQHRFGYELHLDLETALPLKILTLDDAGRLLERVQFVSMDIGPVPARQLAASSACATVHFPASSAVSVWHSNWLPKGFELLDSAHQAGLSQSQDWLVFSDGIAAFSVFVEPAEADALPDHRVQEGATTVLSKRVLTREEQPAMMVTVVGEIPLGTAERIALSMRHARDLP